MEKRDILKEFLRNWRRMEYQDEINCPTKLDLFAEETVDDSISIIEIWAEKHPYITNQRKIMDMFGFDNGSMICNQLDEEWLNMEYLGSADDILVTRDRDAEKQTTKSIMQAIYRQRLGQGDTND